jgi:hypothetical protein
MYVFELYFFILLQGFQNLVGVLLKYLQGQKKTLQEYMSCFKKGLKLIFK